MITVLTACLLACGAAAAGQQTGRATAAPSTQPAQSPPWTLDGMGLLGYSVVLVVGDMQGPAGADTVPSAARKALTDMQAFLPYKRYQLTDAAWILCCTGVHSPAVGRVRGPEEREYLYSIEALSVIDGGKLMVRFNLRDARDAEATPQPVFAPSPEATSDATRAELSRQLYDARKERDDADVQQRRAKQMHAEGAVSSTELETATRRYQLARTRVDDLERALNRVASRTAATSGLTPAARGSILDSIFTIAIGETVVIGTSRLKGDQALIALLTAARKPPAGR